MKLLKRMFAAVLTLCMLFAAIPVYAMQTLETKTVDAVAYYDLEAIFASTGTGTSTNKHYVVGGLYVIEDGTAYLILGKEKNNTVKDIDSVQVTGSEMVTNPEQLYVEGKLVINLPGDEDEVLFDHEGHGHILLALGAFSNISENFSVVADCKANGWDIGEIQITLKPSYTLNKEVEVISDENGEKLQYTITVVNTGEYAITNINVYDDVPTGLTITSVDGTPVSVRGSEAENELALAEGVTLPKGETLEYVLTAVFNEDYEYGQIVNKAVLNSLTLLDLEDDAVYTPPAYFYVYHSATGVTEKIAMTNELLNGEQQFDVTTPGSANTTYTGLSDGTLYGGTFEDEVRETVYPFAEGENGIGFTPVAGETYYVHEPSEKYLRPMMLSIWATPKGEAQFDVKEAYMFTAVDRASYNFIGFDVDYVNEELAGMDKTLYDNNIYDSVKIVYADDVSVVQTKGPYTMSNTFKLAAGHLAFLELPDFRGYVDEVFTVRPYWVTMDNVKVTGTVTRSHKYVGVQSTDYGKQIQPGTDDLATFETIGESVVNNYNLAADGILKLTKVYDTTMQEETPELPSEPVVPEEPVAPDFSLVTATITGVTAGKSDNVKSLDLSYSIDGYDFVDAGFVVKSNDTEELVLADVDENHMVFANYSLKALKKGAVIEITPYWTAEDGSVTYGSTSTLTYKNQRIVE